MNDHEGLKEYLRSRVAWWKESMCLHAWALSVHWITGVSDGRCATTEASFQYMRGDITFFLDHCAGMDDDDLERIVAHELSHVLITEMTQELESRAERPEIEAAVERTTTMLERAFDYTRRRMLDEAA